MAGDPLESLRVPDELLEALLDDLRLSEEELRAIVEDLRYPHGGAGSR